MSDINTQIAEMIGITGEDLKTITSINVRLRSPVFHPTVTLQRVILNGTDIKRTTEKLTLVRANELQDLKSLLRITEASEQRLRGEAGVLRILLGKCVDVIDTIPGESDDECRRLLRLKDTCIEAMKVVL